jgi:hypothetical protein
MNENELRAARIKMARRELLRVLNTVYFGGPVDFVVICEALVHLELPDDECVKRDVTYLCEKGYVKCTSSDYMPWKRRLYKITAKGTEIADEIEKDEALEP